MTHDRLLHSGRVFIIAEAGVNHNGDPALARQLIDAAAAAGADAVKFQLFDPSEIVSRDAPLAAYQKNSGEESHHAMLMRLTLPLKEYAALKKHAEKKGIGFLVTPFDIQSARFLATLGVPAIKIPSGEITNLPFLRQVADLRLFTILSTGMSTMEEVRDAISPFREKRVSFALLHCVSCYPAPVGQINLRAMEALKKEFSVPIGYSDHTEGIDVAVTAAALGAALLEKHFTINRDLPGPDHAASLEPDELTAMITIIRDSAAMKNVRLVEAAFGDGIKKCQPCEENVRAVARRSVVLTRSVPAGTVITHAMLAIKRPGTGIPPRDYDRVAGKRTKKELHAGTVLTWDFLE